MKTGVYAIIAEYGDKSSDISDLIRTDYGIVKNGAEHSYSRFVMTDDKDVDEFRRKQVKFDLSFLHMAKIWGQNSRARRRKVGCLIVRDHSIIADGYNGTPAGFDNNCEDDNGETKWEVLHAEANAITKLAKSNQSSAGATLYITFSPCKQCAKMILQSGIVRVVYTDQHSDTDGMMLLARAGIEISRYRPRNIQVTHRD